MKKSGSRQNPHEVFRITWSIFLLGSEDEYPRRYIVIEWYDHLNQNTSSGQNRKIKDISPPATEQEGLEVQVLWYKVGEDKPVADVSSSSVSNGHTTCSLISDGEVVTPEKIQRKCISMPWPELKEIPPLVGGWWWYWHHSSEPHCKSSSVLQCWSSVPHHLSSEVSRGEDEADDTAANEWKKKIENGLYLQCWSIFGGKQCQSKQGHWMHTNAARDRRHGFVTSQF